MRLAARSSGRSRPLSRRRGKEPGEPERDEILERAARFGITPERVLQEYAHIAFADLRRLVEWGEEGVKLKAPQQIADDDVAAISEIVGTGDKSIRIKLYDKKAALDAIARHLGMFGRTPQRAEDGSTAELAENAREVLARRLARLAAARAEK